MQAFFYEPVYQALLERAALDPKLLRHLPDPKAALDTLLRFETNFPAVIRQLFKRSFEVSSNKKKLIFSPSFQLLTLFVNSPSLTQFLFKHPDALTQLFPLNRETFRQYLSRLKQESQLLDSAAPAERAKQLRLFKYREFIRLAVADYLRFDTFQETLSKLSAFADLTLQHAFRWAGLERYPLAVLALGKLGAQELNYASDVDLMFLLNEPISCSGLEKALHNFINFIHLRTSEGRVFQVDLNIRPEGASGPLCLTAKQYRSYYQTRARPWEIQALLKARVVVASALVKKEQFIQEVEGWRKQFIYESAFSSQRMLTSITSMKRQIEKELVEKKSTFLRSLTRKRLAPYNVKLAPGGIRDLEFVVQFLQLHHSKLSAALRQTGPSATLKTVMLLAREKLLSKSVANRIRKNYLFLRRLEHYLQLRELLPVRYFYQSKTELAFLSHLFKNELAPRSAPASNQPLLQSFLQAWQEVVRQNRDIFENTFARTLTFLEKLKAIEQQKELQDIPEELVTHHLQRLESDYFLSASVPQLVRHLLLLRSLSQAKPVAVEIITHPLSELTSSSKSSALDFKLDLVAFDSMGAFSVLCGLLSLSGLNLLSGASYTYQKLAEPSKETSRSQGLKTSFSALSPTANRAVANHFFRGQKKPASSLGLSHPKIVCYLEAKFYSPEARRVFNPVSFRAELERAFKLLQAGKLSRVREEQIFKIARLDFQLRKKNQPALGKNAFDHEVKPIYVNVDNTSNSYYTLLEVSSEDSFMFLHEFTRALVERNFYLAKIEFSTKRNAVYNRLFLLDETQQKIELPSKIAELKTSLVFIKYFSHYLYLAPNPLLALKHFSRLLRLSAKDYTQLFNNAIAREQLFTNLAKVLGTTQVVFEDFFRTQFLNLSTYLAQNKRLVQPHNKAYLQHELELFFKQASRGRATSKAKASAGTAESAAENEKLKSELDFAEQTLNAFKDRQLFYLELRLLARHAKALEIFCQEVAALADVVVQKAYLCLRDWHWQQFQLRLQAQGVKKPRLNQIKSLSSVVILGLGKWGAGEMGYASDLELMFVYSLNVKNHPWNETLKALYAETSQLFTRLIKSKKHGIFELDFRLRPDGETSPLAVSLERFKSYYHPEHGRAHFFERMALARMRVICGCDTLAKQLVALQKKFVYSNQPFDSNALEELRQKQIENLVAPNREPASALRVINVKFSRGGLVDLEYFMQKIQLEFGNQFPILQKPLSTLDTIRVAAELGLLSPFEKETLTKDYTLLRAVINCLRLVRGNAKDLLLPERESLEFVYLSRRLLHFGEIDKAEALYPKLIETLERVNRFVQQKKVASLR